MQEPLYTQNDLDIALLKKEGEIINASFQRLESQLNSHFNWTMGLLVGIYALGFSTLVGAIGHAYKWF